MYSGSNEKPGIYSAYVHYSVTQSYTFLISFFSLSVSNSLVKYSAHILSIVMLNFFSDKFQQEQYGTQLY